MFEIKISYSIFIKLIFHLYSENKINVRSLFLNEAVLIKCKTVLKWITNNDLLYSIQNSTQYSVIIDVIHGERS